VDTAENLYNLSLDRMGIGGHPCDKAESFKLNKQAADLGHYEAILTMGWLYLNGYGVEKDLGLAEYWYRRSAKNENPSAMFSLGQMAYDAEAYSHARRWFTRAVDHGHIRSLYWLGKLAWRGEGVPQDRSAAYALFHRAARQADYEAIRALRFLSHPKKKPNKSEQATPRKPSD
jgi:TPR repeat protein